ncbi:hypothetical protein KSP40_PGU022658 [Platanthera guangdongensis]|uniref:Maturase K n=1 Tax=Platanthera guangdongensis TaxID=2320717 RepID=A0ABR2LLS6_9ASPA
MKGFVKQCTQCESLEFGHYLEAVSYLHSYQFGFKDVQMFLFSKCCSPLLNLVGLHYYLLRLEIPISDPSSSTYSSLTYQTCLQVIVNISVLRTLKKSFIELVWKDTTLVRYTERERGKMEV